MEAIGMATDFMSKTKLSKNFPHYGLSHRAKIKAEMSHIF